MKRPRANSGAAAFTLVEVLVSLGIFALAAVALGTAYVNILESYHAMQAWSENREELAFARAALLAEPDREQAGLGGHATLDAGGTLRWTTDIEESTRADLFLVTMDFEIRPAGPGPVRRVRDTFLLLRPTWSDPARREELRAAERDRLARRKFE